MQSQVLKSGPIQLQPLATMLLGHQIHLKWHLHTLTTDPMVLVSTSSSQPQVSNLTLYLHLGLAVVLAAAMETTAVPSMGLIGTPMGTTSSQPMVEMTREYTIGKSTPIWTMMDI
jgi:hypothetical protein